MAEELNRASQEFTGPAPACRLPASHLWPCLMLQTSPSISEVWGAREVGCGLGLRPWASDVSQPQKVYGGILRALWAAQWGRGKEEGAQGGRFRGRDWGTHASGSGPGVVTGSSLSQAVTPVLTVGAVWKRA